MGLSVFVCIFAHDFSAATRPSDARNLCERLRCGFGSVGVSLLFSFNPRLRRPHPTQLSTTASISASAINPSARRTVPMPNSANTNASAPPQNRIVPMTRNGWLNGFSSIAISDSASGFTFPQRL